MLSNLLLKVYDNIALHWNHTRGKRKVYWHRVKGFLDALPLGTLLADVGSGDGKYFGVNPNIVSMGCDRSIKLLEVSREPHHETFCCDAVTLPFRSNAFDATLCIAVLHHLSSVDRRYAVISELVRITRPGGRVMLQAWAYEQGKESKHAFQSQDTMVGDYIFLHFGSNVYRVGAVEAEQEVLHRTAIRCYDSYRWGQCFLSCRIGRRTC